MQLNEKTDISMADAGQLLEHISKEMNQMGSKYSKALLVEVEQLAELLERTKQEVLQAGTVDKPNYSAADATLHLEAIIQNTEEAGHKIIDSVSAIQEIAAGIGGDVEKNIGLHITKIYEACSFQDLTTQRITKVIKILGSVSERINNILKLFGAETGGGSKEAGDDSLLNGPQLPTQAPSQSDIDDLFSSLS